MFTRFRIKWSTWVIACSIVQVNTLLCYLRNNTFFFGHNTSTVNFNDNFLIFLPFHKLVRAEGFEPSQRTPEARGLPSYPMPCNDNRNSVLPFCQGLNTMNIKPTTLSSHEWRTEWIILKLCWPFFTVHTHSNTMDLKSVETKFEYVPYVLLLLLQLTVEFNVEHPESRIIIMIHFMESNFRSLALLI